jgi:hypothetical protein
VNIDLKNGAAAQKRSLDPNESQEASGADDSSRGEAHPCAPSKPGAHQREKHGDYEHGSRRTVRRRFREGETAMIAEPTSDELDRLIAMLKGAWLLQSAP